MSEEKRPPWRPTIYKPEYCEKVIECLKTGMSLTAFAAEIDVCRDTVHRWRDDYPDFSDAVKKGLAFAQRVWEKKLEGYVDASPKDMNTTLLIFLMKSRFKDYKDDAKPDDDIKAPKHTTPPSFEENEEESEAG